MNIIQFWIVDTIVKVTPVSNDTQQVTNQQITSDHGNDADEHSPLLPK